MPINRLQYPGSRLATKLQARIRSACKKHQSKIRGNDAVIAVLMSTCYKSSIQDIFEMFFQNAAMSNTIQYLRKILEGSVDSTPGKVSRYFKTGPGDYAEDDRFIGITVPALRKIAKSFKTLSLEDLELLIQSKFNEERLLALIILTEQYKVAKSEQREEIYQFYITNMRYINNWNLVDSSAHLIIGAHLFERDRELLEALAMSKNLWECRIAIVSTWYFIRKSELDWTFRIAKVLLNDPHDLIHKAVGWMLRETGKKNEARLISFLCDNAHQMPKTMLRYATERLSKEQNVV